MSRYIDADALLEFCNNAKSKTIDCNDIARFPSIDIIHCSECVYHTGEWNGKWCSFCKDIRADDAYCMFGRREDEEDGRTYKACEQSV